MEQSVVSVIIPVYNVECYLQVSVESVRCQSYRQLEIILVDDGSDDRSPEICDLYAKKDSRIKVIHKDNGGLVSARKAGISVATGEYIGYVDGDDWLDPDYVERMVSDLITSGADIVCAGFTRDLFEQSALIYNKYPIGVYRLEGLDDLKKKMLSDGPFYLLGITTYVWNKLFKREILYDCQMNVDEKISIGEDAAVTYPAIMESECVCVSDCTSYHYRQREDSMLKRRVGFSEERSHLRVLCDYLLAFASRYDEKYQLKRQVTDYVLGICLMRSGGRLPDQDSYSTFDASYFGKRVAIYNAGTFGQQLVNRFTESKHCTIVKWIDDDYWEYRRCCLDVDSVESITEAEFDYVLIATVNPPVIASITRRLITMGVKREKILTVDCPEDIREELLHKYLYGYKE